MIGSVKFQDPQDALEPYAGGTNPQPIEPPIKPPTIEPMTRELIAAEVFGEFTQGEPTLIRSTVRVDEFQAKSSHG